MAGQGRNCLICSSSALTRKASKLISEGVPDGKVADALWAGLTGKDATAARMRVQRHRTQHIQKPAQAIAKATAKAAGGQPASPEQPSPANPKCRICASPELSAEFTKLLAEGLSDQRIADALHLANSKRRGGTTPAAARQIVQKHRTRCILAPAKALVEAADKGHAGATERKELVKAAESGALTETQMFLSLDRIVGDLRRTQERLERVAQAAEDTGQNNAVAALSAQQLKAVDQRAKLGMVGGYAPQKGDAESTTFSVVFQFGTHTERLDMGVSNRTIDHQPAPNSEAKWAAAFRGLPGVPVLPDDGESGDEDV
jgi:hypothetical protein